MRLSRQAAPRAIHALVSGVAKRHLFHNVDVNLFDDAQLLLCVLAEIDPRDPGWVERISQVAAVESKPPARTVVVRAGLDICEGQTSMHIYVHQIVVLAVSGVGRWDAHVAAAESGLAVQRDGAV